MATTDAYAGTKYMLKTLAAHLPPMKFTVPDEISCRDLRRLNDLADIYARLLFHVEVIVSPSPPRDAHEFQGYLLAEYNRARAGSALLIEFAEDFTLFDVTEVFVYSFIFNVYLFLLSSHSPI